MNYDFLDTPVGMLYIEASTVGIVKVTIIDGSMVHRARPSNITDETKDQLSAYFNQDLKDFDLPLDLRVGTPFQQTVWKCLKEIPYGSTTSYLDIAQKINNPKAVRAVGAANGSNPIPIILPCHRVIGSNGGLVGYSMGIEYKKWFLSHENPKEYGLQASLF